MRTRRYILFLIVAILTFLLGVAAAAIFGISSSREGRRRPCGYYSSHLELTAPLPPLAPQPPAPPTVVARPMTADLKTPRSNEKPAFVLKSKNGSDAGLEKLEPVAPQTPSASR